MRLARIEDLDVETGRQREPGARRPEPAADAVLRLQRGAGNQAVARVLARRAKQPKGTGLRDDAAIARYVRKAVIFWRNNPTAGLFHLANFLGAAANTELNWLGVPDVKVHINEYGPGGAFFHADGWYMVINGVTSDENVRTLGELNEDAVAIVAMNVYHEARHAEQRFRVARMRAGEGSEVGFPMDEDAAKAAAEAPLDPRKMSAQERREAKAWEANTLGEDALYRDAVMTWMGEVKTAARAARDVASDEGRDPEDVRQTIGRSFTTWAKNGALWAMRDHLPSARRRKNATIIADITLMDERFKAAEAAWRSIPSPASRGDFVQLATALRELVRAVDRAYHNQPVEHDAHEVGDAAFDAFHAALKKHDAGH
ncbi:MAG TPA: hypothetical protein VFZ00_21035 [Solirubrobacter sp.]|nr:hypothetical protein [Solirubrobacter sp.]